MNKIETVTAYIYKHPDSMSVTHDQIAEKEVQQDNDLQELEDLQDTDDSLTIFLSSWDQTEMLENLDSYYEANPTHPAAKMWKDFRNKNEAQVAEESK